MLQSQIPPPPTPHASSFRIIYASVNWISELIQVMACRLFGAKPVPEPMLAYCQLDSREQISVKFEVEFYHFYSRKCISNCHMPKWRSFCPRRDELIKGTLEVKLLCVRDCVWHNSLLTPRTKYTSHFNRYFTTEFINIPPYHVTCWRGCLIGDSCFIVLNQCPCLYWTHAKGNYSPLVTHCNLKWFACTLRIVLYSPGFICQTMAEKCVKWCSFDHSFIEKCMCINLVTVWIMNETNDRQITESVWMCAFEMVLYWFMLDEKLSFIWCWLW